MLYKFKSKVAGDVIMLGPNGDQVLRIVGKEPAAKGIIEAPDLPRAIAALEAAVAADEAAAPAGEASQRERVSLRQRAWPLVEMMKRAQRAGQAIVWGV
jgi:Domain of unknown function (DUF1840)